MLVVADIAEARRWAEQVRRSGQRLGLVPTMGALHEGHLSLVRASLAACHQTAVTIFVNPTQFGPHEDYHRYPRTLPDDLELLSPLGVGLVLVPTEAAMYPAGFSTYVEPPAVAARWEGQVRPGHFRGVATVVLKLFHILPADVAYFGQKDYQQTRVIQRMVEDLNVPIEICVCPTVREPDGLAMSSRNRYLTAQQRSQASALYRALLVGETLIRQHEKPVEVICETMREVLLSAGFSGVDYIAIVDLENLEPLSVAQVPAALLVAARLGETRLIDNLLVT